MVLDNTSYNRAVICIDGKAMNISFGIAETTTWTIVGLITVVGNGLSIAKILKGQGRVVDHNIYLISLLSSDLIIGFVAHTSLAYIAYKLTVPCTIARAVQAVTYLNIFVSFCSALAVAINRCRALDAKSSNSLNRMQQTSRLVSKKPLVVVTVIWVCASIITIAVLVAKTSFSRVTILIALLWVLVIAANCLLMVKLCKLRTVVHSNLNNEVTITRSQRFAVKLINVVTITLMLTYFPSIIVSVLLRNNISVHEMVFCLSYKVVFLGPAIDPISYVALSYVFN